MRVFIFDVDQLCQQQKSACRRIGEKKGGTDQIFGGANLDMMEAKNIRISFKDIAGVDEIKDEIKVSMDSYIWVSVSMINITR